MSGNFPTVSPNLRLETSECRLDGAVLIEPRLLTGVSSKREYFRIYAGTFGIYGPGRFKERLRSASALPLRPQSGHSAARFACPKSCQTEVAVQPIGPLWRQERRNGPFYAQTPSAKFKPWSRLRIAASPVKLLVQTIAESLAEKIRAHQAQQSGRGDVERYRQRAGIARKEPRRDQRRRTRGDDTRDLIRQDVPVYRTRVPKISANHVDCTA